MFNNYSYDICSRGLTDREKKALCHIIRHNNLITLSKILLATFLPITLTYVAFILYKSLIAAEWILMYTFSIFICFFIMEIKCIRIRIGNATCYDGICFGRSTKYSSNLNEYKYYIKCSIKQALDPMRIYEISVSQKTFLTCNQGDNVIILKLSRRNNNKKYLAFSKNELNIDKAANISKWKLIDKNIVQKIYKEEYKQNRFFTSIFLLLSLVVLVVLLSISIVINIIYISIIMYVIYIIILCYFIVLILNGKKRENKLKNLSVTYFNDSVISLFHINKPTGRSGNTNIYYQKILLADGSGLFWIKTEKCYSADKGYIDFDNLDSTNYIFIDYSNSGKKRDIKYYSV